MHLCRKLRWQETKEDLLNILQNSSGIGNQQQLRLIVLL